MNLFNQEDLYRLKNLKFIADKVVEGFLYGYHKSPYSGVNIEFSEYRPYMFGDELKNIDWKLWGKTDRLYVKKFEEETNMYVWILLDSSSSMGVRHDNGISKLFYSKILASSLSYIFQRQKDVVGLLDFSDNIKNILAPSGSGQSYSTILNFLEKIECSGKTDFSSCFQRFAGIMKKRGLIILISDMIHDTENLKRSIRFFRHRKNQVVVFRVFDDREKDFPFENENIFIDPETGEKIHLRSESVRESYRKAFRENSDMLRKICHENSIGFFDVSSSTHPVEALTRFFGRKR